MRKSFIYILFISLAITVGGYALAQESGDDSFLGERITQEEFAVELVKSMSMDGWLPTAALASDCVDLLERLGIMPLSGWESKSFLTQEDYLVILAKAHGKEKMLHEKALAVEEKNIKVINQKWEEDYNKKNRWVPLKELLSDSSYFPKGPPKSPYKIRYEDKNKDHKVDPPFLPIALLMDLRSMLATE